MMPEDKLDNLLARGAKALGAAPPMADEVLRRINLVRAEQRPSSMTYRVPLRERIFLMSRAQKVAAAILLALLLAATGWAAEKVVEAVIEGRPVHVHTKTESTTLLMGTDTYGTYVGVTTIRDVPPGTTNQAGSGIMTGVGTMTMESSGGAGVSPFTPAQRQELRKLIAEKKYQRIGKSETPRGTEYLYRFVFSDGTVKPWPFYLPLEEFASVDDYNQKYDVYEARRQEAMQKALAKGHYRLVNVELILVHECLDVATGKTIEVQKIPLPDGSQIASAKEVKPWVPSPTGESEETFYEMTWQEHLDSIKAGRRKLLDARVVKDFWYEMTLEDGSKTILGIGGQSPLEKTKAFPPPSQPAPPAPAAPQTGDPAQPGTSEMLPKDIPPQGNAADFYMAGEIKRPGVYTMNDPPGMIISLSQAVATAGGITEMGDPTRIEITRRVSDKAEDKIVVDLDKIGRKEAPDPVLQNGDLIRVPAK
jgi:hypothetical protein